MRFVTHFPVLTIVLLFTAAFIFPLTPKFNTRSRYVLAAMVAALSALMSILTALKVARTGPFSYYVGSWPPPWGIEIKGNFLGAYMACVITVIGFLVILFTHDLSPPDLDKRKLHYYYTLMFLLLGSMLGIVYTWDLFNLFVFMEINSITACAIISIKNKKNAIEGALKYLILSTLGSGCVLLAIGLLYNITGHLNFEFAHRALLQAAKLYPINTLVSLSFFVVGFSVKSALFPLHVWLPDAHSTAPTPSSALLSGLVLKSYVIGIIKVLFVVYGVSLIKNLPIPGFINIAASLSIIMGSIIAIVQKDIKKMLAYSSIAQIGYIYLGIGLLNPVSLSGSLFHVLSHSITKANLFLAAGNIIKKTGIRNISQLHGLGSKMPLTLLAFTVSSLSMVGLPLLSGFHSKWLLGLGSLKAGKFLYLIVILISSLLNAGYYLPIVISAFFKKNENTKLNGFETTMWEKLVLVGLSTLVLTFGLWPSLPLYFIDRAVIQLLSN